MASPDDNTSKDLQTWLIGLVIGGLIVLALVLTYEFGFDRGERNANTKAGNPPPAKNAEDNAPATEQPAGSEEDVDASEKAEKPVNAEGKSLFVSGCGGCHTLKSAGTSGAAGPNLDDMKPTADHVITAIKNGGSGAGVMPKDIFTGEDAKNVAEFVAATAGG